MTSWVATTHPSARMTRRRTPAPRRRSPPPSYEPSDTDPRLSTQEAGVVLFRWSGADRQFLYGGPMKERRMTAGERRNQLVEVAKGVFAEVGYDAASIEEIASRAGVSKPIVYEHFGGKEGLYA